MVSSALPAAAESNEKVEMVLTFVRVALTGGALLDVTGIRHAKQAEESESDN